MLCSLWNDGKLEGNLLYSTGFIIYGDQSGSSRLLQRLKWAYFVMGAFQASLAINYNSIQAAGRDIFLQPFCMRKIE
ncbi:hypothetical protein CYJ37_20775 [Bacillus sp. UMB0728]|nr:hypothetical protein CYJ37_20775 [Bacillus sp. UMB0728]